MTSLSRCGVVATAVAAAMLLWQTGCGDGSSSSATSGASGSAAVDPGRAIRGSRDLVGSWFAPQGRDIAGLEFTDSGKVMVTLATGDPLQLGPTVMWDYQTLDGGRVSVTQPNGQTMIFTAGIRGDTLTIAPEATPSDVAQFTRLSRQTIAEAHRAEAQRLVEQHQVMVKAVETLLEQPKLAVVSADPSMNLTREALRLEGQGGNWHGQVYTDGNPAVLRDVRVSIAAGSPGRPVQVQVEWGAVQGPLGQGAIQARREVFSAQGEPRSIKLVGQGRQLVPDTKVHDELVAKYEQVQQARQAAVQTLSDRLAARVRLIGERETGASGSGGVPVTLTLERQGDSLDFRGSIEHGGQQHSLTGSITYLVDRPRVMIRQGAENSRLVWNEEQQRFEGPWQIGNNPGINQQGFFELKVDRVWTTDDLAAELAAKVRFVKETMQSPTLFIGHLDARIGAHSGPWPVWAQLQTAADGTVSGQARMIAQEGTIELAGRVMELPLGPVVDVQATRYEAADRSFQTIASQRWQMSVRVEPRTHLVGLWNVGAMRGQLTLQPTDEAALAARHERIMAVLKDATFTAVNSRFNPDRLTVPTFFRIQADASTNQVTGYVLGSAQEMLQPPGLLRGTVSQAYGQTILTLDFEPSVTPRPGPTQQTPQYQLIASEDDDGRVSLSGAMRLRGSPYAQVALTPTTADATADAEQLLRLAAHRAGASVNLPANPQPGTQALVFAMGTTRGHVFFGDGRYRAINPGTAAVHAGLLQDGELGILRVTFAAPHNQAYPSVTHHGVASQAVAINRSTQQAVTMTLERVTLE